MASTDKIIFPHSHGDLYYLKEEIDDKLYYPFKDKEQIDLLAYIERGTPIGSSQIIFFAPTNFQIQFKTITVFRIDYVHNVSIQFINPALTLYKTTGYLMWGTVNSDMIYWFNTVHPNLNLWYIHARCTY